MIRLFSSFGMVTFAAHAQDTLLVEEFTMTFSSYFEYETQVLELGESYFMTIDGQYNISSGTYGHKDAAWYFCYASCPEGCNSNTPCPSLNEDNWNFNITSLRPDIDVYNPNHHYEYSITGEGSSMIFDFNDSAFGDNGGALVIALYAIVNQIEGCTDSTACNYIEEATDDDDSCVYPLFGDDCETGGAACGEGTVWDSTNQSCVAWNNCPSDLDGDGVIGVSDLMQLLADFGTDCQPAWSCGDPVNYYGYDYVTVQIGEQCWFAENLRTEQYQNGDVIPGDLSSSQWTNTESGAQAVYADDDGNLDLYGRLYNGYAMADARALCPTNWHVPSDTDWGVLELELGLDESELLLIGERGDDQGTQLKASTSDTPSWDGTNTSGFSAVANGYRHNHGYYQHLNFNSHYWSQTPSEEGIFYIRVLQNSVDGIYRLTRVTNSGYTVRCVAD